MDRLKNKMKYLFTVCIVKQLSQYACNVLYSLCIKLADLEKIICITKIKIRIKCVKKEVLAELMRSAMSASTYKAYGYRA
jgi:hypothetical protein